MLRSSLLGLLLLLIQPACAEDKAVSAPSTTSSAPAPSVPQAGQKVAFLGDSITQNGFQHPAGYVQLVAKAMELQGRKIEVIPAGVSGNTSRDMLARIKGVLDKKPDWMTLSCGVNDVWHGDKGCTLDEYKTNIASILDQAAAANVKVVVLTATLIQENPANPLNQKAVEYNDFLRATAKERKLPLVDLNADEQALLPQMKAKYPQVHGSVLTDDGVHMNGFGDQMMASGILKAFGFTDAQLAAVKPAWDQLPAAIRINAPAGLSMDQYEKLYALAASQNKAVGDLINDLVQKHLQELLDTPVTPAAPAPVPAKTP